MTKMKQDEVLEFGHETARWTLSSDANDTLQATKFMCESYPTDPRIDVTLWSEDLVVEVLRPTGEGLVSTEAFIPLEVVRRVLESHGWTVQPPTDERAHGRLT